jgi:hypothetical protein
VAEGKERGPQDLETVSFTGSDLQTCGSFGVTRNDWRRKPDLEQTRTARLQQREIIMVSTRYLIGVEGTDSYIREKSLGARWTDFITSMRDNALWLFSEESAKDLAEKYSTHAECPASLTVIAVSPTPDEIWGDIEATSQEIIDQKERIDELKIALADTRTSTLKVGNCSIKIEDDLTKSIIQATLRAAETELHTLLSLKAQLILSYQKEASKAA